MMRPLTEARCRVELPACGERDGTPVDADAPENGADR